MLSESLKFICSNILEEGINLENTNTLNISILTLNFLIKSIDSKIRRGSEEGLDTTKLEDFLKSVERTTLKIKKFKNEYLDKNIKDFSNSKNGIKKIQKDIEDDYGFIFRYLDTNNTKTIKELKIPCLVSYTLSYLNLVLNKIDLYVFSMSKQLSNKNDNMLNRKTQEDNVLEEYSKVIDYHSNKMLILLRDIKSSTSIGNEKEKLVDVLINLNRDVSSKYNNYLGIGSQGVGAGFTSTLRKNNQKMFFAYISKNLKNKNIEKVIKNI
jgi:hypothetical protein